MQQVKDQLRKVCVGGGCLGGCVGEDVWVDVWGGGCLGVCVRGRMFGCVCVWVSVYGTSVWVDGCGYASECLQRCE